MSKNIDIKLKKIKKMKEDKAFKKYIDFIQFPYFKSLEKNTKITFDFPITFFVGKNGCGKSTVLKALYGAPNGYSPSDYWFSTKLDPIEETGEERNRLFYSFFEDGMDKEVMKMRVRKAGENPDYWETARTSKKMGMKYSRQELRKKIGNDRIPPIDKKVLYIDFKGNIGAFDKYFYFENPKNLVAKTKQDYLRNRIRHLNSVIQGKFTKDNKDVTMIHTLNSNEIEVISKILQKEYTGGIIVEHSIFNQSKGLSIYFNNPNYNYSEANAGSGEFSIVKLVHEVLSLEKNSLILLDELEVSLHPGAQRRALEFILDQIVKNQHQVVIATHSPVIIEDMPKESIKVFSDFEKENFSVINNVYFKEAFHYLEYESTKLNLFVEDILAKNIISSVLREMGESKEKIFNVQLYTGGANTIKNSLLKVLAEENDKKSFVVLDGDQQYEGNVWDEANISAQDKEDIDFLCEHLKQIVGSVVKLDLDGNNGIVNLEQRKRKIINYLKYYGEHVFFLPGDLPEDIIFNIEILKEYSSNPEKLEKKLEKEKNSKAKLHKFSLEEGFDPEDLLVKKFVISKNDNYKKIVKILEKII